MIVSKKYNNNIIQTAIFFIALRHLSVLYTIAVAVNLFRGTSRVDDKSAES